MIKKILTVFIIAFVFFLVFAGARFVYERNEVAMNVYKVLDNLNPGSIRLYGEDGLYVANQQMTIGDSDVLYNVHFVVDIRGEMPGRRYTTQMYLSHPVTGANHLIDEFAIDIEYSVIDMNGNPYALIHKYTVIPDFEFVFGIISSNVSTYNASRMTLDEIENVVDFFAFLVNNVKSVFTLVYQMFYDIRSFT